MVGHERSSLPDVRSTVAAAQPLLLSAWPECLNVRAARVDVALCLLRVVWRAGSLLRVWRGEHAESGDLVNAFEWLNDLMRWLGRFVPRLQLVKATEGGVLFCRGGQIRSVSPGLCFYWPLVSELKLVPTTQRTQEICAQLVGDETISMAIFWRVVDPACALTRLTDLTGNLDDYAQSTLSHVCSSSEERLLDADLRARVADHLRETLKEVGIAIVDVGIVHRGRPLPVKLINDWATHEEVNRA